MDASGFDAKELEELRGRLGLSRDIIGEPYKAHKVRAVYPGVIPWWYAHFYAVFAAVFLIGVVLVPAR